MPEEINFAALTEEDVIRKLSAIAQRHIANLDNSLAMMRNGHFIDAYQRISGTKEGLLYIKYIADSKLAHIGIQKQTNNENNTQ